MMFLIGLTAALACIGAAQALAGAWLVAAFARQAQRSTLVRPPITVLKPLYGDEPMLEAALSTLCEQDYPDWQIVFGVQDHADPAIAVVERLRLRFPDRDIALVVDATLHGRNRKVGNLLNMLSAARHNVLVIADSDVHVRPDYLDRLVEAVERPGIGLVTTLYIGLPFQSNIVGRLGAAQISYSFLPGALLSRAMGRQDCLGATMAIRRAELERIGGFAALVDHLADDNVLGRRVKALGLGIALARTVPLTTVPETRMADLFRHELRWARTIRALEPAGFAASIVQYPLFWALLTIALTAGSLWSVGLYGVIWAFRAIAASGIDRALAPDWPAASGAVGGSPTSLALRCPVWLLPLRDVLSTVVMAASYAGRRVEWRGHDLHADSPPPSSPSAPSRTLMRRPPPPAPMPGTSPPPPTLRPIKEALAP